MWEAYMKDNARLFREIQGREWGRLDDVWKFLYRIEGVMIKIRARLQDSAKSDAI
jgi:hypothetical protein